MRSHGWPRRGAAVLMIAILAGVTIDAARERILDVFIARALARTDRTLLGDGNLHVILCGTGAPVARSEDRYLNSARSTSSLGSGPCAWHLETSAVGNTGRLHCRLASCHKRSFSAALVCCRSRCSARRRSSTYRKRWLKRSDALVRASSAVSRK